MGLTALSSPLVIADKGSGNQTALPNVPQAAPSMFFGGTMLQDPRYLFRGGEAGPETNALLGLGVGVNCDTLVMDQAPSTAAVNNIAAAAHVTSGTAMTLVSSSGAGITVLASALAVPQSGNTIASGKLAIDLAPGLVTFGTGKSLAVADPAKNISRCLSITVSSGGAGGALLVSGSDLYGFPMTEKITAASSPTGATTTNGKKAFKFVSSVTPQFTDAFNYSVGTADIVGFPLAVTTFPYARIGFAGSPVTASTGFVAAVSTTASNTTGDVRGTYALQSSSNGVLTLQMFISLAPSNLTTMSGYFGVTQA